jgi:hypothetical protein
MLIVLLLSTIAPVSAQEDTGCPIDAQLALQISQEHCVQIGLDRVCYGNWQVTAEAQPKIEHFVFDAPGDRESVAAVRSLSLSAMDPTTGIWGIAHMRLLVVSASLEPADVSMVLFGDVGIENQVDLRETVTMTVNSRDPINVRQYPGRYGGVVATLAPQAEVTAVGRLADNSWFRVETENRIAGWVLAALLTPQGDADALTIESDSALYYRPMQSFLYSSADSGSCAGVPADGMLIQTPEGQARVSMLINEVSIDLISAQTGSTTFLQAEPGGDMTVTVLEGSAMVSAGGTQYTAIAGTQVLIPLGPDLTASGPPDMPQPYDPALVGGLVSLGLDPTLDSVSPATLEMILAANGLGGDSTQTQTQTTTGSTTQTVGDQPLATDSGTGDTGDTGGGGAEPTPEPGGSTGCLPTQVHSSIPGTWVPCPQTP